jgi:hypothetical protein
VRYVIIEDRGLRWLEVLLGLACAAGLVASLVMGRPVNVGDPGHRSQAGGAASSRPGLGGPAEPPQANEAGRGRALGTRAR